MPKPPLIFVLDGLPGAGKTTLFNRLRTEYADQKIYFCGEGEYTSFKSGEITHDPLEKVYGPTNPPDIVCNQLFIYMQELEKLVHSLQKYPEYDTFILDRWDLSCQLFTETRHELGQISKFSRDFLLRLARSFHLAAFQQLENTPLVHILVLDTPINHCVKRIFQRHRPEEMRWSPTEWKLFAETMRAVIEKKDDHMLFNSSESLEDFIKNRLAERCDGYSTPPAY